MISSVFWLPSALLSLKTDVNVPAGSTGNKQKKSATKLFFVCITKATDEKTRIRIRNPVYGSKGPDSYRIKMS